MKSTHGGSPRDRIMNDKMVRDWRGATSTDDGREVES